MKVTGPRSPNWALFRKMVIPCNDGEIYLIRYRLVDTPWFGVYLHDIRKEDQDYDPHDHPWVFWSFILRGFYGEVWWRVKEGHAISGMHASSWRRWSLHKMTQDKAHKIHYAEPGTWSLIVRGRRNQSWGFYTQDGLVDWRDYKGVS